MFQRFFSSLIVSNCRTPTAANVLKSDLEFAYDMIRVGQNDR